MRRFWSRLLASVVLCVFSFVAVVPASVCLAGTSIEREFIGVGLMGIDDRIVISADYEQGSTGDGKLLIRDPASSEDIESGAVLRPGVRYLFPLSVCKPNPNPDAIDFYWRTDIYRRWEENGERRPDLNPDLIRLSYVENTDLMVNEGSPGREKTTIYGLIPVGSGDSRRFTKSFFVDPVILRPAVLEKGVTVSDDGHKTVTFTRMDYGTVDACLDVGVDAIQTHNVVDAILSAWGMDVTCDKNGRLSFNQ